jgi:putative ABC transport system permease protein
VLLKPGTDVMALQAKLPAFAERYMGDMMKQNGVAVSFNIEPIKDIHIHSRYDYEMPGNGNLTYLKYLGIAALFILFIAWINYINLSTARSLDRAKEVGVRKVIGAGKRQLIRQFLTESLLVNLSAIILAIAVYILVLPSFGRLIELNKEQLSIPVLQMAAIIAIIFFSGAILAGAYPSFILSSFSPMQALKQTIVVNRSNKNLLRKSLVVVQFFAAIILIAGAIGFYKQLHYMSTVDLGINIRQTLILHQPVDLDSSKSATVTSFVNDLESYPGIQSVTLSSSVPGSEVGGSSYFHTLHTKIEKRCRDFGIDNKFIRNYHLDLLAGRNFSVDKAGTDTTETNVILNQAAVKVFGFTSDAAAVGEKLSDDRSVYKVIGVIKDFHQKSLQSDIDPIIFYTADPNNLPNYSLKISKTDPTKLIEFVRKKWVASFPESPFSYDFLDQRFDAQYKSDRLFSIVLWLFTILAIIVASLGLFGLTLYTVAKRAKEISIRKVLGATVYQITRLLAKDYLKLILIAALPAIPVAYYVLSNWLNDYAFHISIGWWFVVTPIVLIVAIAMSTVIYHSLRATLNNPVKNLRSE